MVETCIYWIKYCSRVVAFYIRYKYVNDSVLNVMQIIVFHIQVYLTVIKCKKQLKKLCRMHNSVAVVSNNSKFIFSSNILEMQLCMNLCPFYKHLNFCNCPLKLSYCGNYTWPWWFYGSKLGFQNWCSVALKYEYKSILKREYWNSIYQK